MKVAPKSGQEGLSGHVPGILVSHYKGSSWIALLKNVRFDQQSHRFVVNFVSESEVEEGVVASNCWPIDDQQMNTLGSAGRTI